MVPAAALSADQIRKERAAPDPGTAPVVAPDDESLQFEHCDVGAVRGDELGLVEALLSIADLARQPHRLERVVPQAGSSWLDHGWLARSVGSRSPIYGDGFFSASANWMKSSMTRAISNWRRGSCAADETANSDNR